MTLPMKRQKTRNKRDSFGTAPRTGCRDKAQRQWLDSETLFLLAESCCQSSLGPPQIKKKSIDKAKQEERMSKEFAAMEEAALKAYQEDLKRMEREAAGWLRF